MDCEKFRAATTYLFDATPLVPGQHVPISAFIGCTITDFPCSGLQPGARASHNMAIAMDEPNNPAAHSPHHGLGQLVEALILTLVSVAASSLEPAVVASQVPAADTDDFSGFAMKARLATRASWKITSIRSNSLTTRRKRVEGVCGGRPMWMRKVQGVS